MAPRAISTLEDARNPFLMVGLDCFQVLINTLKYSQMLTNYLLYARSTIVMVWRTQGRAFVKVGWSHEEPRQKYKCSMYNNILTLKPKANFYNNWVLPVEKHTSHFQQVVLRKKPGRPDSEESFGGKRHVRCQISEIHLSGTRYSNKGKCHPIHCKFRLNLELCSILILMTFLFSVTKKRLLISITEMKMCLCVVRMTPLKTILGFSQ